MKSPQADIHTKKPLSAGTAQKHSSTQKRQEEYEVEDSVPITPKAYSRKSKYPFFRMRPGQSVLITGKNYQSIMGVLRRHKDEGKKFIVRNINKGPAKEDMSFRVWRES